MFLIKPCPSCAAKLRFPITKGKIKVTCPCGNSFSADPDDPELYRGAEFDISEKPGRAAGPQRDRKFRFSEFFDLDSVIKKLYAFRYTIQNFRLLPATEQKKIISRATVILLILLLLLYVSICRSSIDVPSNFL